MTHHGRPSFALSDNMFHFVDDEPAVVLEMAREAAQGRDVRLGGGATTCSGGADSGRQESSTGRATVALPPTRAASTSQTFTVPAMLDYNRRGVAGGR
jgi:hypothetical protein